MVYTGAMTFWLFHLFVLWSIGFWSLAGVATILLFLCVENEKPGFATLTLIGSFALLALCGDFNVIHEVIVDPLRALFIVGLYFGGGGTWSFFKWWFYVKAHHDRYMDLRAGFLRKHNLPEKGEIPNELRVEFKSAVDHNDQWSSRGTGRVSKPIIRENKGRIVLWMIYWPWSAVWTLINDPVKKTFEWMFHRLQGVYQFVADSIYRNTKDDFNYIPPPPAPAPADDKPEPKFFEL
jgi:hypothetical protein